MGKIAVMVVPFMCIFYIGGALVVILKEASAIPATFKLIFSSAFTGTAAIGGFGGAAFAKMIQVGMARAVYSNEAGWGSSPMIHATAKVNHPVKQGSHGDFRGLHGYPGDLYRHGLHDHQLRGVEFRPGWGHPYPQRLLQGDRLSGNHRAGARNFPFRPHHLYGALRPVRNPFSPIWWESGRSISKRCCGSISLSILFRDFSWCSMPR